MPYVAPTTADLKLRFPVFAQVNEAVLQAALGEAANRVDQTWREEDFQTAQLLYAAHVLTSDGHGTGREAKFAALGDAGISSIKISSLAVSLNKGGQNSDVKHVSVLSKTSFGKRFLELLRLNHPAIVVANVGP